MLKQRVFENHFVVNIVICDFRSLMSNPTCFCIHNYFFVFRHSPSFHHVYSLFKNFEKSNVIAPEFGIDYPLDGFTKLKIPKGKDILERFYTHFRAKPKGHKAITNAASKTATDLIAIWQDACVPLQWHKTVKDKIEELYGMLVFVRKKSWKDYPSYAENVRKTSMISYFAILLHH